MTTCSKCNGQMILDQDATSRKDVAIEYNFYHCVQCGREQYLGRNTKAVALELLNSNITYTHREIATALDLPEEIIQSWAYHYV